MRFKKENPKIGEVRIIIKFLLLPLEIDNETRWLEVAKIKQRAYLFNKKFNWNSIAFMNK